MKTKKSWADRLNSGKAAEVKPLDADMFGMKAGQMMLVPSPRSVDEFIRTIPEGASMDVKAFRAALAERHDADVSCPITTGILLRIVSEAAYEAHAGGAGVSEITPFWRVLDENSSTAQKLACGPSFIADQRRREGIASALLVIR